MSSRRYFLFSVTLTSMSIVLLIFINVTSIKQLMNYSPSRSKLIIITLLFLIAGFWGVFLGLIIFTKPNFILTALGFVNISLGIFLGFKILRMSYTRNIKQKK